MRGRGKAVVAVGGVGLPSTTPPLCAGSAQKANRVNNWQGESRVWNTGDIKETDKSHPGRTRNSRGLDGFQASATNLMRCDGTMSLGSWTT